jgi:hypothetical protein
MYIFIKEKTTFWRKIKTPRDLGESLLLYSFYQYSGAVISAGELKCTNFTVKCTFIREKKRYNDHLERDKKLMIL